MHPITWWLCAVCTATTLVRLNNNWITLATLLLVALIVKRYRTTGPWASSFNFAVKLALFIITFRVLTGILIGVPVPGTTLFTLPTIPLPEWMAGIRLGGAVTWERVSSTILESMNIASIIILFGAATSLTNPRSLIRSFPPIFYELGMILIISISLTPQLVSNLKRIKSAQDLRGVSKEGFARRFLAWRQVAMPLLEDSLARSLDLAAAMDSRGYGISRVRSKYRPQSFKWQDTFILFTALISAFLVVLVAS